MQDGQHGRDLKLLATAAEEALQRIREDREKVPERLKPLLEHIEMNLFNPELTSPTMMAACKVRDHSMATVFGSELKATPTDYIRDRRMETAIRLLSDTDLHVWEIGGLVFDDYISNFSARFRRWAGCSPKAFRKAARKAAEEAESAAGGARKIAQAILGGGTVDLASDQLDYLIHHLRTLQEAKDPAAPPPLAIDGPKLERGIALVFWEELRYLPAKEQKALVRQPYSLPTPALFDVLREKSREEGRKDRQAGVQIAELALASLDGVAAYLTPEELANRKAQGWAWLGNARRLALDFPAARRAFGKARKLLPKKPDLQVLAMICELEGELYLFQSKFEEALALKDRAVELFRSLGKNRPLAESLLTRAAAIGYAQGFGAAIPDFLDALEVAESLQDPHLKACIHQGLVGAYALAGQTEEALRELPVARAYCANTDDRAVVYQLQWAEGLIARRQGRIELAEELFLAVRSGFLATGESGFAATVDLDLAELYLKQGRESEAVMHTLGATPVFKHFGKHPEAVAALTILADIGTEQAISLELIHTIRGHLTQVGQNPLGLKS